MNILLQANQTPFDSVPFSIVTPELLRNAIFEAIEISRKNVEKIIQNTEKPTFKNTIAALDSCAKPLSKVSKILFNLNSAETDEEIQNVAKEVTPKLTEFYSFVSLNKTLYDKVNFVYENENRNQLTEEEQWLLERKYLGYKRSGAGLEEKLKQRIQEIDQELALLGLQFNENILAETNEYYLTILDENELLGLPNSAIEMARNESKKRNIQGYTFTLQMPSLQPVLKFAKNRELRKKIALASAQKGYNNNPYNNEKNVVKIVRLREEKAKILSKENFASLVLEARMAETTQNVETFLNDLLHKAKPFAEQEIAQLKELAKQDGITEIQSYDHAFYAEKLREKLFDINEEKLKEYFPLHNVLEAVFSLAEKLFNIQFIERQDIETYHNEVKVFEVTENGTHKALLYTDFFPRKGKKQGAWMTSFREQYKTENENVRPLVSIVCNFTPKTETLPSLLNFQEVTTLFHEMGHALHLILSEVNYVSVSGTNVFWDFVELPSQFLENFCYEKEFLMTFAKHYQTNESLSETMIDNIVQSANFLEGYQTVRQLSFGLLDLQYHSAKIDDDFSISAFEKNIMRRTSLYPIIENTSISTSFLHIFSGGYASGYYSYKWAEVLDADAFDYFKENGIFNVEIATKYKNLLRQGGSKHPMKLYEEFRGRKPNNQALLKRAGLV